MEIIKKASKIWRPFTFKLVSITENQNLKVFD